MPGENIAPEANETTPEVEAEVVETKKTLTELTNEELIDYVKTLRKENASHRTEKQATKKELDEFRAWKDSQKTELERAQEKAAELQKENYSLLKTSIALGVGLSLDDVDFISGETPEEMKASAEKLAARVKPTDMKKSPVNVFAGSRGAPVSEGPKDTKALANQWLSSLVFRD